jgi:hypothetical protein
VFIPASAKLASQHQTLQLLQPQVALGHSKLAQAG